MKRFTLFLAVLAFAAVSASAQNWTRIIDPTGTSNNVAAASTNSYLLTLDATDQLNVGFCYSAKCVATNSTTTTITFDSSIDASLWQSNAYTFTIAQSGTTPVTLVTNVSVGGVNYLRLNSIGNPGSVGALTNITFQYSAKRPKSQ